MPDLRTFLDVVQREAPDLFARVTRGRSAIRAVCGADAFAGRRQAPHLMFERVAGHAMPVVSTLFASKRHLALALGTAADCVVERFSNAAARPVRPTEVRTGPVKEVVLTGDRASLSALPMITHCEKDQGPYLSSGVTIMRDPRSGALNAGLYRHRYVSARR